MRVVVLGAAGPLGTAVVDALRDDPDKRVDAVVALTDELPPGAAPSVEWHRVAQDASVAALLRGIDAAVVLSRAYRDRRRGGGSEVDHASRLLDEIVSAGVRHVVVESSFAAYSPAPAGHGPVGEDWPTEGLSRARLARDSVALERAVRRAAADHGITRFVTVRAGVPLGPGTAAAARSRLGAAAPLLDIAGRSPLLPALAGCTLPVLHHDDVASALRLAVTSSVCGPLNAALDDPLDLASVPAMVGARPVSLSADSVGKVGGIAARWVGPRGSAWLDLVAGAPTLDTTLLRKETGWAPLHSLDDTLRCAFSSLRAGPRRAGPPSQISGGDAPPGPPGGSPRSLRR